MHDPAPHRRTLLMGAAAALVAPALAWGQTPRRLAFEVWRGGRRIGTHTVVISAQGGGLTARITAALLVKLGPVPIFRYRHDATEVWSTPDQFASLETRTISNGKVETVAARREGEGVRIERSGGASVLASARTVPLTHWNRGAMSRPLFNPQTGVLIRETIARRADTVKLADGQAMAATAYALTGDAEIIDWYDASSSWVALRGKVADGSFLEYRRLA